MDTYKKAKDYYLNNKKSSVKEVSKMFGVSRDRLRNFLKEENLLRKSNDGRKTDQDLLNKAINLYKSGYSLTKASKEVGIGRQALTIEAKRLGIEIINKQNLVRVDESKFEKIESEEQAYWLGFLYADGNIYGNRVELGLKQDDIEHLKKFKNFMKFNGEVKSKVIKLNGKTYNSCRISFNSKKVADDLKNLGCVPKKSLVLRFPTYDIVPKHLMKHFIRGYVDGDGSVMWDKTYNRFRLSILGTIDMLEGIEKEMNFKKSKTRNYGQVFSKEWGAKYVKEYLEELYENSTIYLNRKYEKYSLYKCRFE
ncbi:hypothetical protein N2W52_002024 [Clostridium perfringens]|nr:hypothetical protein [Clostridium perfringens]MDK0983041.1 hypothetical protein [Clostridium perfringens]